MQSSEFFGNEILGQRAMPREQSSASVGTRFAIVVMLLLSALIAVDRLYGPRVPINVDPASYAVIAHELIDGKQLYTDIWDHKPPAPFVTYALAEIVLGYSSQTLHILSYIVCLMVLWSIYLLAKQGPGGRIAGLIAALLWAIVSGSFGLEGRDPNTEPLIDAFVVFAFYLIVANRKEGLSLLNALLAGVLFFCASLYKPVVAANVVFLTGAFAAFAENRKRAFYNTLAISAVGVAGWLMLFGYFAATGRGDVFYRSIVVFNMHYSGSMLTNVFAPVFGQAEITIDVVGPLAVFAVIGTLCSFLYEKRLGVLISAFIISSWIALAATGRFSVHYYQLWLPSLVIASAWGIGYLFSSTKAIHRPLAYAAVIVLAATLFILQLPVYRAVYTHDFIPQLPVLDSAEKTVAVINSHLREGETFYLWGNTPNLYLLADRRPPAAVLFDNHLRDNPISSELIDRVHDQLARSRPEMLVVEQDRPPAPEWLTKDFESTPIYSDSQSYSIYARNDGRIAKENR